MQIRNTVLAQGPTQRTESSRNQTPYLLQQAPQYQPVNEKLPLEACNSIKLKPKKLVECQYIGNEIARTFSFVIN
jgi:hypothetical protein